MSPRPRVFHAHEAPPAYARPALLTGGALELFAPLALEGPPAEVAL